MGARGSTTSEGAPALYGVLSGLAWKPARAMPAAPPLLASHVQAQNLTCVAAQNVGLCYSPFEQLKREVNMGKYDLRPIRKWIPIDNRAGGGAGFRFVKAVSANITRGTYRAEYREGCWIPNIPPGWKRELHHAGQ